MKRLCAALAHGWITAAAEGRSSHAAVLPLAEVVLTACQLALRKCSRLCFACHLSLSNLFCGLLDNYSAGETTCSTTEILLCYMADPLSLAAAAAGFVGLAGQLAQGVVKLKDIYTTIKDAPKDVADLCTKMESLQGVLEEVGDQIQQLSHGNIKIDRVIFCGVMAQCETSRYRIEAHVKKLGECFRGNRAAAVRFVFKKKEIQEMLFDVETCKSSLIIARQSIDGYVATFPGT